MDMNIHMYYVYYTIDTLTLKMPVGSGGFRYVVFIVRHCTGDPSGRGR
jgi:hypothetical protein